MNENIAKGFEGEKFVHEIASKAYLSYWCYPNPKDEDGDKKEICDLIIFFNGTLILFGVKNYTFKDNYQRYFNSTIKKDIKQLQGAERKLLKSNRDISIKNNDGRVEVIKIEKVKKVHRIIVHLGENIKFYPFKAQTKKDDFIHVFDKHSFRNIVTTLDTIKDIEYYLEKRESAFKSKNVLIMPGEEDDFDENTKASFFEYVNNNMQHSPIFISGSENDLLAHYYKSGKKFFPKLNFDSMDGGLIQIDGAWNEFTNDPRFINKKNADEKSYFIDKLVENEILKIDAFNIEELAKEFLLFSRFERRTITNLLFNVIDEYGNNITEFVARRHGLVGNVNLLLAYYTPDLDEKIVDKMLEIYAEGYMLEFKDRKGKIIVLGTTHQFKQFKFLYYEQIVQFPEEYKKQLYKDLGSLGWFKNGKMIGFTDFEFPTNNS